MTKNLMKHSYTILLLLLTALLAVADSGRIYMSGQLSSTLINCVAQDKYGYVWVGTEYGLNKFDGYHFTSFLHNNNDTTTVSDNIITDFLVDKQGRFWIGSAKGLMRYDYHGNNFVRYPFPDGRRPRIYSIIESQRGDVLVGTAGFGLYAVRKGNDFLTKEKEYAPRDSDMFYAHIYEDDRRQIWQSSHLNTFSCFSKNGGKVRMHNFTSPCGAPVDFFQREHDRMLIICMGGIISYDYRTGAISDAGFDFGPYKDNITINRAMFDHRGNLYVATSESGVLVAEKGSRTFTPYSCPNKDRFDMTTAYVKDLMEDKDHNLWLGCYRKGLCLVNDQKTTFSSWSFSEQNYSIGSSVSSLTPGEDGGTWCTVQNSGVYQFDKAGQIVAHPTSPAGTSIIYRDKEGDYWVGSGNALYSYEPTTGASQEKIRYTSDGTFCMTDDGRGHLFISVYSKGLYIYDKKTGSVKVINMAENSPHGRLCNDWIRAMLVDRDGLLWLGTSNGVACLNPSTLAFDTFGWNSLLHNIQANSLCEDSEGNIIIGSDEGLYRFDRRDNRTTPFPHSEMLKGKQICAIVMDKRKDLWVSTSMGIWQYDSATQQFIGHINGNGLLTHEYAQGALMHADDDRIAFGMGDGITTFYPDDVRNNRINMGVVYLTAFLIDGKPIDCLSDDFTVAYSENSFTLQFSLLNYKNPDDISFQYRINNGNWISTGEGVNSIPFTKLEPGEYDIDVRATNNGAYSKGMRTIHVTVRDPWYASTWAWLVYLLLAGGLTAFLIQNYKRRQEAELEESKMRFLIDATHDIKSPLTLIVGPLRKLKKHLEDDEESQANINIIERNAQRLVLLVNQILDERKIDKNQMHLHCQETELNAFVSNICSLYRTNAEERNITLRMISRQKDVKVWIDRINFDKVVSNLLSNAFKYSFDNGEIDLIVGSDGQHATIDVRDTGIGFKDDKTEKLFERFYQGKNSRGFHIEGTGIGLNLCRSIVQMHGGTITAANRKDTEHGAIFSVAIPLGTAHLKPEEIISEEEATALAAKPRTQASKNCRILIVDDDREIGQYIKDELSAWYRFDYCQDGKSALKKLLTEDFDVVISDVMMNEMDGITLLKKIKTNSNISDIPVILLTSKTDVQDRLEGLRRGADAYLAKPFNMDELHVLIDNLIDNRRRMRGKFSGALEQTDKVEKVTVKGNDDALMERVMKSINEHLSDPEFNVDSLTKDVGISRAQLHRKMKEMTGVSTGEFIRNLRLEQAARLICEGKINITQVAYNVGFNNQTHFSTIFKKHFGMTPTEYSERHKQ